MTDPKLSDFNDVAPLNAFFPTVMIDDDPISTVVICSIIVYHGCVVAVYDFQKRARDT